MSMNTTPKGERIHIALFGRRNAGKSSLINAITGQDLAIVSDVLGTTTDPVYKAMEILPLGPVMLIDTPGLDDEGVLGEERIKKARSVLNKTDLALIVADGNEAAKDFSFEHQILALTKKKNIPSIVVLNKQDLWAENEVELACEHEKSGDDGDGFSEYGCACYRSALKAFDSLMEDGHSGMSIGITKNILNRLIAGKPLTPIVDTEDIWDAGVSFEKNGERSTQCKRMSSLFKHVKADGSISYNDVSRTVCVSINNLNNTYHNGLVDKIMDEMFPITMPYMPSTKPFYVYCEDFLYDTENGDFDTVGVFYVITPNGEKVKINRFFAEKDNKFEEIDIFKYDARKEAAEQLKKAGEKND